MTTLTAYTHIYQNVLMNRALPYLILAGMVGCLIYAVTTAWASGTLSLPMLGSLIASE